MRDTPPDGDIPPEIVNFKDPLRHFTKALLGSPRSAAWRY